MAGSLLNRSLDMIKDQGAPGPVRNSRGDRQNNPYQKDAQWKHDKFGSEDSPPQTQKRNQKPCAHLRVTNVHYEVSVQELESLFTQIGPLKAPPKIIYDRSGRSKGIAELIFENPRDAADAKDSFDGAMAKGEPMTVSFDYKAAASYIDPGSLLARVIDPESLRKREPRKDGESRPEGEDDRGVGGRGRGGRGRGRGRSRASGEKTRRGPPTQDDLDKELEAYINQPVDKSGDVEMQ